MESDSSVIVHLFLRVGVRKDVEMNRLIQVDLVVHHKRDITGIEDVSLYYVILTGPGIEIILPHTAAYFDRTKKFVVTIAEME